MKSWYGRAILAVLALAAMPGALAQQAAPGGATLKCEGPFAKDSSHAKLVEAFGAPNVAFEEVDAAEGEKMMASVVFAKDPKRRLEITWKDEAERRMPGMVLAAEGSAWTAGSGLRIGTSLADVEAANGKPFKLSGFDWDYGGTVNDWQDGTLAKFPGCRLGLRFEPDDAAPPAALKKVAGDQEFASNDPNMRAAKPKISEIFLAYPD